MPKGRPRNHSLNDAAFDAITPESAYWMGFLFADGAVGDDGCGSPWLATHLAERDRAHVEKLRAFLGSSHAITRTVGKRLGGPALHFRVRSRPLVAALQRAGMCPGKEKRAPCDALVASRDFWRGAVDGDGSVGAAARYPYFAMHGSATLLDCMRVFLTAHGFSLQRTLTASGIWRLQTRSKRAGEIVRLLYGDATVALDRKLERANAILSAQVQGRNSSK